MDDLVLETGRRDPRCVQEVTQGVRGRSDIDDPTTPYETDPVQDHLVSSVYSTLQTRYASLVLKVQPLVAGTPVACREHAWQSLYRERQGESRKEKEYCGLLSVKCAIWCSSGNEAGRWCERFRRRGIGCRQLGRQATLESRWGGVRIPIGVPMAEGDACDVRRTQSRAG
jgi:hypothetical protein